MPGPLRHLGELARARATRRTSERDDGQALAELETRPLELPDGLEIEWLGVSGYRITHEGQTLFIDPYLSRVPFLDILLRRPNLPQAATLDRFLQAPLIGFESRFSSRSAQGNLGPGHGCDARMAHRADDSI